MKEEERQKRVEERKKGKEKKDGCRESLRQQKMATLKRHKRTEKENGRRRLENTD